VQLNHVTPHKDKINYLHWQSHVNFDAPSDGAVVVGVDDLLQEIYNVVLTPKGSAPLDLEKGVEIYDYVDRSPAEFIPMATRDIWLALQEQVTRIVVENVIVSMEDVHHFSIEIAWKPLESVDGEIYRVTIVNEASA